MVEYEMLVIADDITGATDTGVGVAQQGLETKVVTTVADLPESEVLVADTDSRYIDGDEAYERVVEAIRGIDADTVYKKVDSTLRGNLLSEVRALVEATESDLVVVAPAFPAADRTTVDGTHYVTGDPIHHTGFSQDAPDVAETSHLPTILSDLPVAVRSLTLDDLEQGEAHVREQLQSHAATDGQTLVVCDAVDEDHLATVGTVATRLEETVAYVGSGGLSSHVSGGHTRQRETVLAVVGSVTDAAFSQLQALPEEHVVTLAPELLLEETADGSEAVEATLANCQDAFVAVTAATSQADVQRTLTEGRERGLSDDEIGRRVAETLGRTVHSVSRSCQLSGLFVTGGETYRAVLDALDVSSLSLTGIEVESGVPLAVVDDGPSAGTPICSKAGAFGDRNTIQKCLDFLYSR